MIIIDILKTKDLIIVNSIKWKNDIKMMNIKKYGTISLHATGMK